MSFRELTDELIEKARAKAEKPIGAEELRRTARRVGAPVTGRPIDRAARELIAELGKGRPLDPTLRHLLTNLLQRGREGESEADRPVSDSGLSVAAWVGATPEQRGDALVDLLLLADAVPSKKRGKKPLRFPPLAQHVR
ncbi:MAG TPA: hypothetical protein VFT10_02750 [Solirubrobacterales bacterium]|nr:hypothetical protein [Solirubrobacterales bacterium]